MALAHLEDQISEAESSAALVAQAFHVALLASDLLIAWHSGVIDAEGAMAGLEQGFQIGSNR